MLKSLFEPPSVAVVGALREPGKLRHEIVKNILDAGFKGKLYPINPKADEVLGLVLSLDQSVPVRAELAVVVVPARFVPSVISDCGVKRIKAAVVISRGFSERGEAEAQLERQPVEAA